MWLDGEIPDAALTCRNINHANPPTPSIAHSIPGRLAADEGRHGAFVLRALLRSTTPGKGVGEPIRGEINGGKAPEPPELAAGGAAELPGRLHGEGLVCSQRDLAVKKSAVWFLSSAAASSSGAAGPKSFGSPPEIFETRVASDFRKSLKLASQAYS